MELLFPPLPIHYIDVSSIHVTDLTSYNKIPTRSPCAFSLQIQDCCSGHIVDHDCGRGSSWSWIIITTRLLRYTIFLLTYTTTIGNTTIMTIVIATLSDIFLCIDTLKMYKPFHLETVFSHKCYKYCYFVDVLCSTQNLLHVCPSWLFFTFVEG